MFLYPPYIPCIILILKLYISVFGTWRRMVYYRGTNIHGREKLNRDLGVKESFVAYCTDSEATAM